MKTTTILLAGILSTALSFPTMAADRHAKKNTKKHHSENYLKVAGKVVNSDYTLSGATVNLYCGNDLVKTVDSKHNGTFKLKLDFDCDYTIECEIDGFVTKRIALATAVPQETIRIPTFRFTMELFQEEDFIGVDDFMIDFPVALISYEPKYNRFDFHREYTYNTQVEHEVLRYNSFLLR